MGFPQKVRVGTAFTQFPGASFNALVDGHNAAKAVAPPQTNRPTSVLGSQPYLCVLIQNTLSSNLEPGDILGFSEPIFDLTEDEYQVHGAPAVKGITPDGTDHASQFVILKDYIRGTADASPDGAIGPAVLMGLAWAKVNFASDGDEFCNIVTGETKLQSSASGIAVVWKESGTGEKWALVQIGGGGGGGSVDIKIVLIDDDIPGSLEYDPRAILEAADIELTEDEVTAGYTVVFQDPADDDYDENQVDELALWGYKRRQVDLKYFTSDPIPNAGTATAGGASTITLDDDGEASTVDDFYEGDTVTLTGGTGSGQTRTISGYVASTRVATVSAAWTTNPDSTSVYEVNASLNSVLATTIIDDAENEPPRKVVRYATTSVKYDDGDTFSVGEYKRSDYPDYDENEPWPPSWVTEPDTFFKKRYRGIVIGGVLITALCQELPAPELPPEP